MSEAKSESGGNAKQVKTAGEATSRSRGGTAQRARPSTAARRRGSGAKSPTGAGARLLAPLALIICAIAVFTVIGGNSETTTKGSSGSEKSSESRSSSSGSSSSKNTSADGAESESGEVVPAKATYKVKPGDSFAAIAEDTGVDVDKLSELNPDIDPRALQPGQKLKLK